MIKFKKKKKLFVIGAVALIAVVGGTIAMNRTLFPFNNDFELGIFKTELSEEFDSPTGWKPCDTTDKVVSVKNVGTVPAKARIAMDESWIASDEETKLDLVKDNVKLANVTFPNNDWVLDDGYYYLNKTLQPGESSEFISAVTFNCEANFAENTLVDGAGNVTQTADPYDGASFHLGIKAQLMQDKAGLTWAEAFNEYVEPSTFSQIASGFIGKINTVKANRTLTGFKRSKVLPNSLDASANLTEVQASGETPIYLWYSASDTSLYWYSSVDAISWNRQDNVGGFFSGAVFYNPPADTDISGMRDWDMRQVTTLGGFFYGSIPDDISALAHWKLTGVSSFGGVFSSGCPGSCVFKQKHMPGIEYWDVSNLRDLSGAFGGNDDITDLSLLSKWDVRNVTSMSGTFYNMTNLTSLKGLEKWKTNSLNSMSGTFSGNTAMDISALANWDVSHVENFNETFKRTSFTNLAPIVGWDVSSGTDFGQMFEGAAITDATPLNVWNVSNSASLIKMFYNSGCTESTYPTWYTAGRRS